MGKKKKQKKHNKAKEAMYMNRSLAGELGRETVNILKQGHYHSPLGTRVDIQHELALAVERTESYPPEIPELPFETPETNVQTQVYVNNETTLAAASRLAANGHRVALLNFASAKNPGGGFQNGARAQEESLARSSGLFACIDGNEMYAYHRRNKDCLYSNYAIYSPNVPVIRHDDGTLLGHPYHSAMITSPAVNAGIVLHRKASRTQEVKEAMAERINKVLSIAAHHNHDALVLGAWGCGVFRNKPEEVADLFADALQGTFRNQFAIVTFAILDYSKQQTIISPFERALL